MNTTDNILRWLDDEPPTWPKALVIVIDAMRDYIRSCTDLAESLVTDGDITKQQYDDEMKSLQPMRDLLKELESYEIDRSLRGILET